MKSRALPIPEGQNSANFELEPNELIMAMKILQSVPYLISDVTNYLGGSYVIQEAYHFVAGHYNQTSKVSTSGFWHRDDCGRRIKLFICLDAGVDAPVTNVVSSPFLDPNTRSWEMYRAAIPSDSPNTTTTEELNDISCNIEKLQPKEIKHVPGTISILDTNAIHRGAYQQPGTGFRHLIQISMIPKVH